MFAEYTRRYQEIILQMPDEIYLDTEIVNAHTLKYMSLYFNLCSEESHLWESGIIPSHI